VAPLARGHRGGAAQRSLEAEPPAAARTCPWQLGPAEEAHILEARRRTNLGPARLAALVGRRRSTVWKVLHRHGVSRRRRTPAPARPRRRDEWAEPGALLHVDTKQLPRFDRPGHFAHGERAEEHRSRGAGYLDAHCVVDDRTRLAYRNPVLPAAVSSLEVRGIPLPAGRLSVAFDAQGTHIIEAPDGLRVELRPRVDTEPAARLTPLLRAD
jgi:hypothetical protein